MHLIVRGQVLKSALYIHFICAARKNSLRKYGVITFIPRARFQSQDAAQIKADKK
jgi:hypothetical protein